MTRKRAVGLDIVAFVIGGALVAGCVGGNAAVDTQPTGTQPTGTQAAQPAATPTLTPTDGTQATVGPVATAPAQAQEDLVAPINRITTTDGSNIAISVAMSEAAFPRGGVEDVLLARDDVWADSLASATAQGALEAPLLLTDPQRLDPRVRVELRRLGTERVVVLGGEEAVTPAVIARLEGDGYAVERLAGDTRDETARILADRYASTDPTAVLVRGFPGLDDPSRGFVDALAAGAWSTMVGDPLLLTAQTELPEATLDYLHDRQPEDVLILGGSAAVSEEVPAAVARVVETAAVQRVAGANRYATAVAIASGIGFNEDRPRVLLLDGAGTNIWAAAFASAIFAQRAAAPILLVDGFTMPAETQAVLEELNAPTEVICGPRVSESLCNVAQGVITDEEA